MDKALLCTQCNRFSCICERTKTTSASIPSMENSDSNTANKAVTTQDSTDNPNPNPNGLLRRASSQSSSSLNFGTNIFKRFAERMSSNSNIFSASLRNSTTSNDIQTEKT